MVPFQLIQLDCYYLFQCVGGNDYTVRGVVASADQQCFYKVDMRFINLV